MFEISGFCIRFENSEVPEVHAFAKSVWKKVKLATLRQCLFFIQRKDLYLGYFYKFSQAIQNRIFQTCLIASSSISATLCTILLILKSWLAGRGGCRSVCSVRRPAVREGRRSGCEGKVLKITEVVVSANISMYCGRNTSEASGISVVPAMAALLCLSEASLQKQSSIGARPKTGNASYVPRYDT